jgi:phospholipid-binding lipoprotein MlaA
MILPAVAGKPFTEPAVALGKGTLSAVDERANSDDRLRQERESADPYAATRDAYLKRRQAEIDYLRGKRASVDDAEPEVAIPGSSSQSSPAPVPVP